MEANQDYNHDKKNMDQPLNQMNENSVSPSNSDGTHDNHLDQQHRNEVANSGNYRNSDNYQRDQNQLTNENQDDKNSDADYYDNEDLDDEDDFEDEDEIEDDENSPDQRRTDTTNVNNSIDNFRL